MGMNSTDNNPDNSLLRHYSLLSSSFLIEEDSLIESLPSLYFNEDDKKEDTEEDDTEEDDDDYTTAKEQKTPPADYTNMTSCLIKKAASAAVPLFPASSSCSSQSIVPPPIQTYSPQLNLSLYSPSPSVASSIRSTKKSRSSSSNSHHSYSLVSSAAASPSTIKSSCASTSAAFASSAAARNPTFKSIKRPTPLYSTATISSSSKIASTIKMDIRSPPQPSQSTSRFMNAFHRFRNSSSSSANTINQKNASYHHHQNTTNSVAPAEIVSSMKPSPSKSSLADKIKSKFHKQLDKKKNRTSLVELSTKKKALSNFSMPRSASLSSMTNWSSRLSGGNSNKSTPLKKGISVHNDKLKLSHSASVSSRLSISSSLSSSSSCSSSSSSSASHSLNHPSHRSAGDTSLFMQSQIATSTPATSSSAFSLTKSISSHRLYNKSSSEASSSNSDAGSSSRQSHQTVTRPRQPLRAVNPNDSVRFVMRQSSPMSASGNSRKSSLQQQQHQKTIVRFSKLVSVRETYSKADYDRGSDPDAVCTRLTPAMAQQIKEELNAYKLHEMQVHEYSRVHTHFFI